MKNCTTLLAAVVTVTILSILNLRAEAEEPSRSFFIIAPKDEFSLPLVIAKHPSAARLTIDVFNAGSAPMPYYGWLMYTDTANQHRIVTLKNKIEIDTADAPGEVSVKLRSAGAEIGMYTIRVGGFLINKRLKPDEVEPDHKEEVDEIVKRLKEKLSKRDDDISRANIDELERLRREVLKPPGKSRPPARDPLPPANGVVRLLGSASRVRVLLAVDTDADNIGSCMWPNEVHIRSALKSGLGNKLTDQDLTVWVGQQVKPDRVRNYYRGLTARREDLSEDTLFFYYCGHGGTRSSNHILTMKHGELLRRELRQLILDCKPRLAVIVTDCCANFMQSKADDQLAMVIRPQRGGEQPPPILSDLLLYHGGVVDINACRAGDVTWCDPFNGGHFTKALCDACTRAGPSGHGRFSDGFTSWGDFFADVQVNAMRMPQKVVPFSFSMLNKD